MNSSVENPKLPMWLFIVADLALLATAALIATRSAAPLSHQAMLGIVTCVGLGALIGVVPFIVYYERQKNEALDERQRALEALAQTVSSSAEQISIATGGLHEIADAAQKHLRQAEQLPQKLQEKIAEFQARLSAAEDAEKEELERELLALRTTEGERLESVSQRIAKSAADWVKLVDTTQQHLAAANEAVSKISFGTASAIGKAQAAAEQALTQARVEAARSLGDAAGQGSHAIETAKVQALAEAEQRLAAATTAMIDRVARELDSRVDAAVARLDLACATLNTLSARADSPVTPRVSTTDTSEVTSPATRPPPIAAEPAMPVEPPIESAAEASPVPAVESPPVLREATTAEPAAGAESAPAAEPVQAASSVAAEAVTQPVARATPRPRKPRPPREEPAAVVPPPPSPPLPEALSGSAEAAETNAEHARVEDEPAPVRAPDVPEGVPVVPHTAEPFSSSLASAPTSPVEVLSPSTNSTEAAAEVSTEPKAPRKRAAKKFEADDEPNLGFDLDEPLAPSAGGPSESVITSDGATRLIITAYIGIGNRLFIRGSGPGLSWEKGVPLQFISIGKWRWETNDATTPLQFKILKNDDTECTGLGTQTLDPGHQQELTAAF